MVYYRLLKKRREGLRFYQKFLSRKKKSYKYNIFTTIIYVHIHMQILIELVKNMDILIKSALAAILRKSKR